MNKAPLIGAFLLRYQPRCIYYHSTPLILAEKNMAFDWHSAELTRSTVVNQSYKNTQNVRRFLQQECGESFKFDRDFMAWIRSGTPQTLGDIADEWLRRQGLT